MSQGYPTNTNSDTNPPMNPSYVPSDTYVSKNMYIPLLDYPRFEPTLPQFYPDPSQKKQETNYKYTTKAGGSNHPAVQDYDPNYFTTENKGNYHCQPDTKRNVPENVIGDGVRALEGYPFPINQAGEKVSEMRLKLNNAVVKIDGNTITSDVPIMISIKNNIIYVWNTEFKDCYKLTNKGGSIKDGYRIQDFDGKTVKVATTFQHRHWYAPFSNVSEFRLDGNNNTLIISSLIFDEKINMKIYGKNSFNICRSMFDRLTIYTQYSDVNYNGSQVKTLNVDMEGVGTLKGLVVHEVANVKIVGDGKVIIDKCSDAKVSTETYGGGIVQENILK